jgi:tetratricopeptide (TPR) repeat protein
VNQIKKILFGIILLLLFSGFCCEKSVVQAVNLNLQVVPDYPDMTGSIYYNMHKASHYEANGQQELAIKEYLQVLELKPDDLIARYNLGSLYYERWLDLSKNQDTLNEAYKYLDLAEEEFLWINEISPGIVMVYFKLGRIASIKEEYESAIAYYTSARKLAPKNYVVCFNLATIYEETGEIDLAIVSYKDAVNLNKDFTHAYNNLGLLYERRGNLEQAIKYYNKALKTNKKYVYSHLNLGSLYTLEENYKKASKHFAIAKELEPSNPWVYLHTGYMYDAQGKYIQAFKEYSVYVKLKPLNPKGYYLICSVLKKLNMPSEAMMAGILYLKLDPQGEHSSEVKGIIKEIQNDIIKSSNISKE